MCCFWMRNCIAMAGETAKSRASKISAADLRRRRPCILIASISCSHVPSASTSRMAVAALPRTSLKTELARQPIKFKNFRYRFRARDCSSVVLDNNRDTALISRKHFAGTKELRTLPIRAYSARRSASCLSDFRRTTALKSRALIKLNCRLVNPTDSTPHKG